MKPVGESRVLGEGLRLGIVGRCLDIARKDGRGGNRARVDTTSLRGIIAGMAGGRAGVGHRVGERNNVCRRSTRVRCAQSIRRRRQRGRRGTRADPSSRERQWPHPSSTRRSLSRRTALTTIFSTAYTDTARHIPGSNQVGRVKWEVKA